MLHEVPEGSNFFSDFVSVWVGFWGFFVEDGLVFSWFRPF
jgi:hypothetical protein